MSETDERYMSRALTLARSVPNTSPNPRVGAVLVRAGEVIAEGFHRGPGTPHAEAEALSGADARGATIYVTLEPCSHHGHTAPCAPALVQAGVAGAVVAIEDPDARVSGAGLAHLRDNGIEVTIGVLAAEAALLNAPFLHHRRTGLPLVSLKLALSLDGRLTAPDGSARWISGPEARRRAHERRLEADAVLVGVGTVLVDDPRLTARDVDALRQPLRVVVDSRGRTPEDAALFREPGDVLIATTDACHHEAEVGWKGAGAEVVVLSQGPGGVDLDALLSLLGDRGVLEVLCEGGAGLATTLLASELVERLEIHFGPKMLGRGGADIGDVGVTTIERARTFTPVSFEAAGDDLLATYMRSG